MPESFRGGCSFGADRADPAELSRRDRLNSASLAADDGVDDSLQIDRVNF
jgi:hypothetical protein